MTEFSGVDIAYFIVALTGAFVALFVKQMTELDEVNKRDRPRVQWVRRAAFTSIEVSLILSLIFYQNWSMWFVVLLVAAGVFGLFVNGYALYYRSNPEPRKVDEPQHQQVRLRAVKN